MSTISADLLRAISRLRKATQAELHGNAYYLAANQIANLSELMGAGDASADPPSNSGAGGFVAALASLRAQVEKQLSGNVFYLASWRLDELAFLAAAPPGPPRSFDDIAAAAKSRVETVRASLGLSAPATAAGTLSDELLETRSSEPCAMAELAAGGGAIPAGTSRERQAKPSVAKDHAAPRPRAQKSLFGLWLDMLFGRKN